MSAQISYISVSRTKSTIKRRQLESIPEATEDMNEKAFKSFTKHKSLLRRSCEDPNDTWTFQIGEE